MPFLIAVVLAIVGFIWWSWGRDKASNSLARGLDQLFKRRECRWITTGDANGRFVEYRCQSCGVASYSTTGKAPVTCKRNLKNRG